MRRSLYRVSATEPTVPCTGPHLQCLVQAEHIGSNYRSGMGRQQCFPHRHSPVLEVVPSTVPHRMPPTTLSIPLLPLTPTPLRPLRHAATPVPPLVSLVLKATSIAEVGMAVSAPYRAAMSCSVQGGEVEALQMRYFQRVLVDFG